MGSFAVEVNNRVVASALQKAINAMPDRVDQGVQRSAIEVGREMQRNSPKAESTLALSFNQSGVSTEHVVPKKNGLMEWRVGPHVDYAQAVEEGSRGGGFVPFQVLFAWIKRKQIQPRNPEWDQKDLTFVMQKSILAKGTPKQPFAKPVVDSGFAQTALNRFVGQAATKAVIEAGL